MKKFIFVFNILLILSLMTFVGCSNNNTNNETGNIIDTENTNNETGNIKGTEGIHYQKISGKEEYQVVDIGTASELDIVIPKEYNGLPITKIADDAFRNEKNIESVIISGNVITIGDWAFANCNSLRRVELKEGVEIVGDGCFSGCTRLSEIILAESLQKLGGAVFVDCTSLFNVVIPNTVEEIGGALFRGCYNLQSVTLPSALKTIPNGIFYECKNLQSISLPTTVTSIGSSAFMYCSKLESINISKNITSLGECIFDGCEKLESISVEEENMHYKSIDGVLYNKNVSVVIHYPMNKKATTYTMPNSVIEVFSYAFAGNRNITNLHLSNSLKRIEWGAFSRMQKVNELTIPQSVIVIGPWAFGDCQSLTRLNFEVSEGWAGYETEESVWYQTRHHLDNPESAATCFVCYEYHTGLWWKRT